MLEFAPVINLCPEAISIVGEIIDRDDVYWTLSSMAKKMSTFYLYRVYSTLHYLTPYTFIWSHLR